MVDFKKALDKWRAQQGGANVSAATNRGQGAANGRSIILTNVRLSFPDLFVAKQFQGNPNSPFQYKATFLIQPGSANDKIIREAINNAAKTKWADKAAAAMQTIMGQSQKFCYIDGNQKEYDGYQGMWALTSARNQDAGAPAVVDKNKTPLMGTEGKPYGGCYVNAKVTIWAQDNQWGKGMRCTLEAVQFAGDGDAFGGSGPASADGFEEVAEEATETVSDLM
jgi:hypothetical protein